jgi:hypothetical protein
MSYPFTPQPRGLGETLPASAESKPFSLDGTTLLLLLAGAFGLYVLAAGDKRTPRRRRYDEIGNVVRQSDRLFYATYTSPDEEYQISNYVAAKNRAQAIARMKEWAQEQGESTKGAKWDAYED